MTKEEVFNYLQRIKKDHGSFVGVYMITFFDGSTTLASIGKIDLPFDDDGFWIGPLNLDREPIQDLIEYKDFLHIELIQLNDDTKEDLLMRKKLEGIEFSRSVGNYGNPIWESLRMDLDKNQKELEEIREKEAMANRYDQYFLATIASLPNFENHRDWELCLKSCSDLAKRAVENASKHVDELLKSKTVKNDRPKLVEPSPKKG